MRVRRLQQLLKHTRVIPAACAAMHAHAPPSPQSCAILGACTSLLTAQTSTFQSHSIWAIDQLTLPLSIVDTWHLCICTLTSAQTSAILSALTRGNAALPVDDTQDAKHKTTHSQMSSQRYTPVAGFEGERQRYSGYESRDLGRGDSNGESLSCDPGYVGAIDIQSGSQQIRCTK